MNKIINLIGLKPEQIEQTQAIIEAFQAKNKLDNQIIFQTKTEPEDIIDVLTKKPIKVDGFLSREEIYED